LSLSFLPPLPPPLSLPSLFFHSAAVLIRSSSFQNHFLSSRYDSAPPLELLNAFRDVCNLGGGSEELSDDQSPTNVIEVQGGGDTDRISLPMSISVRSNAYLKIGQNDAAGASTKTRSVTRPRNTNPLDGSDKVETHDYCFQCGGGGMEEERGKGERRRQRRKEGERVMGESEIFYSI
ncbi:hypothetical protein LINPERPRIM_LOCUS26774, partial [Linum perenne]